MKLIEIQTLLNSKYVRKSKGGFKYWASYYWGFTKSGDELANYVLSKIPKAVIINKGNHYHAFVGGAKSGSAKDSFLWVTFTIAEYD